MKEANPFYPYSINCGSKYIQVWANSFQCKFNSNNNIFRICWAGPTVPRAHRSDGVFVLADTLKDLVESSLHIGSNKQIPQ